MSIEHGPFKGLVKRELEKINVSLLEKEKLVDEDVKQYLVGELRVGKLIEQRSMGTVLFFQKAINRLRKAALDKWDSDRSNAFLGLLNEIQNFNMLGMDETLEACVRCSMALAEWPLVIDKNVDTYGGIISRAMEDSKKMAADQSNRTVVMMTFLAGVVYNASLFCPAMFDHPLSDKEMSELKDSFYSNLDILQGKPPISD